MSRKHPIDQVFGRRLEHLSSPVPVNLWAKIDKKRTWKHKLFNQFRLHRSKIVLFAFFSIIALGILTISTPEVMLDSFPIPMKGKSIEVPSSSFESPKLKPKQEIEKVQASIPNLQKPSKTEIQSLKFAAAITSKKTISQEKMTVIASLSTREPKQSLTTTITKANHLHNFNLLQPKIFEPKSVSNTQSIHFNFLSDDPVCATFGNGRWRLYASALLSPDLVFRKLESKNSESDSYVQSRESTESQHLSYSAGLNITAVSGFGLSIRTGLNYAQINERFNYVNEREETITITNDTDPVTGEIISSDTTVVIGTRIKTTHNRYQSLDIPILLGYELHHNEKWSFAANAGVSINIISRQKGDFLSPTDLTPVSFSSNDPVAIPAFKDQVGISWYGSLGAYYQLNPKWQIAVEPYFKLNPSSISKEQYVVDQKYLNLGLWMGLRMKI